MSKAKATPAIETAVASETPVTTTKAKVAKMKLAPTTTETQVAETKVAEVATTKQKGVAKGELKDFAASVLAKVQSGELTFSQVDESTFKAEHNGICFTLTKREADSASAKNGKAVRIRMTAEKFDAEGNLIAKRPETNGKDIWMHYVPDFKFPYQLSRLVPEDQKKTRVKKAKVVVDHGDASAWL